jgi:hypothetical protein
MTKKEKEEMEAAKKMAALRWTEEVKRDVPVPESGFSEGWDFNANAGRVWLGWSDRVGHGTGAAPTDWKGRIGSQGSRAMYSSKLLALKAMRHEMERMLASQLYEVDKMIAKEKEAGEINH